LLVIIKYRVKERRVFLWPGYVVVKQQFATEKFERFSCGTDRQIEWGLYTSLQLHLQIEQRSIHEVDKAGNLS
jgi:hypothetical protein